MAQMEYRLDNIKRAHNRPSLSPDNLNKEPDETAGASGVAHVVTPKRPKMTDSYGCVSWEPHIPTDPDRLADLKFKQRRMQDMSKEVSPELIIVKQDLKATYCLQRKSVNVGLDVDALCNEWPFLFQAVGIETHFEQLLGKPLLQTMLQAYTAKVPRLLAFFGDCKKKEVQDALRDINIAKAEIKNSTPDALGILLLLSCYFGENLESLILTKDVSIFFYDLLLIVYS